MGADSKLLDEQKRRSPMATTHSGKMELYLQVWAYAEAHNQQRITASLAQLLNTRIHWIQHRATWKAKPKPSMLSLPLLQDEKTLILDAVAGQQPESFCTLVIGLTTTGIMTLKDRKPKPDMFEDVLRFVNEFMRLHTDRQWGEGYTALCWALFDPVSRLTTSPSPSEMAGCSVWVLPAPTTSVTRPAEKIEALLHELVGIKHKRASNEYRRPLGGRTVLRTIEDQLYVHKTFYAALQKTLVDLKQAALGDAQARIYISDYIKTLENVGKALSTLVHLYDQNVGKVTSNPEKLSDQATFKWLIERLARLFIRSRKFGSLAIDDQALEELKSIARRELRNMQRLAPIVAAHVRLQDSRNWRPLKAACGLASDGPEKSELPSKLAVVPEKLGDRQFQIASIEKVSLYYETSHDKVLEQIEALGKCVGKRFAEDGTKIFRDRKDRKHVDAGSNTGASGKRGRSMRLLAKLTKRKKEQKLEVAKGLDSDVDSASVKSCSWSGVKAKHDEKV